MKSLLSGRETEELERDFYISLSQLAAHYGIIIADTGQYDYPYNIALALQRAKQQLKAKVGNWYDLRLVKGNNGKAFLISEERCCTGSALYYIPVVPLYSMLHEPKRRRAAQLLLSVYSYLYHRAGVPYYSNGEAYLYWQYEMLADWVEEYDGEEGEVYKRELQHAGWIGEFMQQKLYNLCNLDYFEKRVQGFTIRDTLDRECYRIASNTLALYREYRDCNVFGNVPKAKYGQMGQEDEDMADTIGMEKYISFVAHTKGILYESLESCVNCEFNECSAIEEPTLVKCFDGIPIKSANLDFEDRLFTLMDDLCYVLYNYKNMM